MSRFQFIVITPENMLRLRIRQERSVFSACPSLVSICKATLLASLAEANVDADDFVDKHMYALRYARTENDTEFKESCLESFCRIDSMRNLRNEVFLTKSLAFTKNPDHADLWRELLEAFRLDPPRLTFDFPRHWQRKRG